VLGERGYHGANIGQITRRAGCSRASFYQYFASKEEVFRHLTGQVARELTAALEAMPVITPDLAGRTALRDWTAQHAAIHARFAPVFSAFDAAARVDEEVKAGSQRWERGTRARFRSRVVPAGLPEPVRASVTTLLRESITGTFEMAATLRAAEPGHHHDDDRLVEALADVLHRALFGVVPGVNATAMPDERPATVRFDRDTRELLRDREDGSELTATGRQTRDALKEAGVEVFVARGYHLTRVDDVVARAGVSHGAFYRYFDTKDDLARALARDAARAFGRLLAEFPTVATDDQALRAWLERHCSTQMQEAAVLRVWVDAAVQDATLRSISTPAVDWARRTLADGLAARGFGDIDADALFLLAFLNVLGSAPRDDAELDAASVIVRRALLGREV
jgi:AcrR family transcriptional regulator